jgi:hypothetical protein
MRPHCRLRGPTNKPEVTGFTLPRFPLTPADGLEVE